MNVISETRGVVRTKVDICVRITKCHNPDRQKKTPLKINNKMTV